MLLDVLPRSPVRSRPLTLRSSPFLGALLLGLGCGSPPPAEAPAPAPEPAAEPAPPPPTEPEPELSDEAAALIAEAEGKPIEKKEAAPLPKAEGAGHDLTYRVKPDSLAIQVLGVTFTPKVKTRKLTKGYGIEIVMEAKATQEVVIAEGAQGPLALAVLVSGKSEVLADKKTTGGDVTLGPGQSERFIRSWPTDGGSGLETGEAEIQVGLWGLGTDAASKKPVRKFFVIQLKVDGKGATATVAPPKGTGKK